MLISIQYPGIQSLLAILIFLQLRCFVIMIQIRSRPRTVRPNDGFFIQKLQGELSCKKCDKKITRYY